MKKVVVDAECLFMSNIQGKCPFDILGLQPHLELNLKDLDQAYYACQRQWHPDGFSQADEHQQQQAEQMASAINIAYQCLKNPVERYWAVLQVCGAKVDREAPLVNQPQFMEKIMDLQEQADELTIQSGTEFYRKLNDKVQTAYNQVADLISKHQLSEAVLKMHWLTYLTKLQNKVLQRFSNLQTFSKNLAK